MAATAAQSSTLALRLLPPPAPAWPRSSRALARFVVRMRRPAFPSPMTSMEKSAEHTTLLDDRVLTLLD
jgi:hypothetical protein